MKMPTLSIAAGWSKKIEHVRLLAETAVEVITVGSIMVHLREGNASPQQAYPFGFREDLLTSINWLGLPGPGALYYAEHLPEMVQIAHSAGKKLRVSIAGFTPKETVILVKLCIRCGADEIELNFGCPNTIEVCGGTRLSTDPICYSSFDMWAHIITLKKEFGTSEQFSVKLSPGMNEAKWGQAIHVINQSGIVNSVVLFNTIPDGYLEDEGGNRLILGNNGRGGIGGRPVKELALEYIPIARDALRPDISIIACGGVFTGLDVLDYARLKVSAVQVGTAFFATEDRKLWSHIATGFHELV